MTNYEIIKSHLEYEHKVEGKNDRGTTMLFVGYFSDYIVSSLGVKWSKNEINLFTFLSITPIPHRYKKLEVGTKVDVLEGHGGFDKLNSWELRRYCEGGFEVELFKYPWTSVVPLWAIAPHVEEESLSQYADTMAVKGCPYLNDDCPKCFPKKEDKKHSCNSGYDLKCPDCKTKEFNNLTTIIFKTNPSPTKKIELINTDKLRGKFSLYLDNVHCEFF